jgi:hypothetical protein
MEAQATSPYGALAKYAYDVEQLGTHTLHQRYTQQVAARKMAQLILMSLGLGAGAAGLRGLKNIIKPRKLPYQPQPFAQQIDLPVPGKEEEEEEKFAAFDPSKLSREALEAGPWKGGLADLLAKPIFKFFDPGNWPQGSKMRWLGGNLAKPGYTSTVPFGTAIGLPAAVLTGLGGFGLTEKLIARRQKATKEEELEEARAKYEQMLRDDFAAKQGSADEMLDEVADAAMEKEAFLGALSGAVGGPAIAYALLSSLLAGKLSYDYFKGRSEEEVTEEAMRQRAKQRAGGGMLPAYITTTPQQLPAPGA